MFPNFPHCWHKDRAMKRAYSPGSCIVPMPGVKAEYRTIFSRSPKLKS